MNVPPGGGPPPHRHDFEEMFTLIDGEIEFTFRGETSTIRAGSTINIPANAPHSFRNKSSGVARMLCMCTPAGQEEFFMTIGDQVASRTSPPPKLSNKREARRRRAEELAPRVAAALEAADRESPVLALRDRRGPSLQGTTSFI